MNSVLLTGSTGFVGRNLIPRIIAGDSPARLLLLIRGTTDRHVARRLERLLSSLAPGVDLDRARRLIRPIRGDVTLPRLGLPRSLHRELASEITHVIHAAASVKFGVPHARAARVNVTGTQNVLELAHRAARTGKLRRLGHVSTAYVSGDRQGTILEDELDRGQGFANSYERTKSEAERLVRQLVGEVPATILRPGIIVGDSRTGRTSSFNVLYHPLRLIHAGEINALPGYRETRINVIPVDFVCDAIHWLVLATDRGAGRTYHLTSGATAEPTAGEIVDGAVETFNRADGQTRDPILFLPPALHRVASRQPPRRGWKLCPSVEVFAPYICGQRRFDRSAARPELEPADISPPLFASYFPLLLRYCLETQWGRAAS